MIRRLAFLLLGCSVAASAQGIACEGNAVELRRVDFVGNHTFRDGDLANLIATTQSSSLRRYVRVIGQRFCLDSAAVDQDATRLALFYRNQGFLTATVTRDIVMRPTSADVRFTIVEGEPVIVDSVSVLGLAGLADSARLVRGLPLRVGGRFARDILQATRDTLTRRLRDTGYPLADVLRNVDPITPTRRSVWYEVVPGPRMRVDSIAISTQAAPGRTLGVRPRAVKATLGIREKDVFSQRELEAVKRGLYLTGAYQHVDVSVDSASLHDAADSLVRVNVTLRETEMRQGRASVGFGNLDCVRAQGSISTLNFLGGLRRVDLNARLSRIGAGEPFNVADGLCIDKTVKKDPTADTLNYYLGVTYSQPALFGRRTLPSVTIFSERRYNLLTYLRDIPIGVVGSMVRNAGGRYPSTFSYQLEYGSTSAQPAYFCAVFNVCDAESYRQLTEQQRRTAIAGWSIARTPPDLTNPSRGWGAQFEVRHASRAVGSDPLYRFTRASLDAQLYRQVLDGGIFVARVRAGTVLGARFSFTERAAFVPPQERLYAGGANTVRGYGQNELGPIVYIAEAFDTVTAPNGEKYFRADPANPLHRRFPDQPTGGDNVVVTNAELRLRSPLYPELVQYALFVDAGAVWNRTPAGGLSGFDGIKVTPGMGLRVFTPIGPLRFDAAIGPRDFPSGSAYYRPRRLNDLGANPPVYCISPSNTLPVDLSKSPAAQTSGACPASYDPLTRHGLLKRLRFHFQIGQAF